MKRIISSQYHLILLIGLFTLTINSCNTLEVSKKLPILTTDTISAITQNTAICGGNITSDNGLEVSLRGVCWSFKPNPTITDSLTKNAAGTGKFTSQLLNLVPDTTYYVRAFATNSDGTAYGLQVTFRTTKALLPTLTTTKTKDIIDVSAISGGNITSNGGTNVIQRGVCWGTNTFPTILDNKTNDGSGDGVFSSTMSGLIQGTFYFIRAYATNKVGTAYGNQDTIKTLSVPIIKTIFIAQATSQTTAVAGGVIEDEGGASATVRGICWNTSGNPTINDTKIIDGSGYGQGSFTCTLTNLTADVTYFVRAFASNKFGTAYGNTVTIKTLKFPTNGLVAWYPFNGNADDLSGNGNHGTVNGTVSMTTNRNGIQNSAYSFHGLATEFINVKNSASLQLQNNISLSAWIFMDGGFYNPRIIDIGNYGMFVEGKSNISRSINCGFGNGIGGVGIGKSYGTTTITIPALEWHHVVFTVNSDAVGKLYIDGQLVATKTGTSFTATYPTDLNIGRMNHSAFDAWGGKLDDIGIWNRALSQEEVTSVYTNNE